MTNININVRKLVGVVAMLILAFAPVTNLGFNVVEAANENEDAPKLLSFDSNTSDGTYGPGDEINITATYNELLIGGSQIIVILNNGARAELKLDTIDIDDEPSKTLSGTYTVGDIGSEEDTADLTVESVSDDGDISSVYGMNGDERISSSVPASPNNLGDSKDIVIEGTEPISVTIESAITGDTDANGHIDFIDVTFSTDIDSDSVNPDGSNFTVEGNGKYRNVPYTVISASEVSAGVVRIALTEKDLSDTGEKPFITIISDISDSTGQGVISSGDIQASDGAMPVLLSFTAPTITHNQDGTYGVGESIKVLATYSEPIKEGSSVNVVFDTGGTAVLNARPCDPSVSYCRRTVSAEGTYTVMSGEENSDDLTVESISAQSVADAYTGDNTNTSKTLPSTNIADDSDIVIEVESTGTGTGTGTGTTDPTPTNTTATISQYQGQEDPTDNNEIAFNISFDKMIHITEFVTGSSGTVFEITNGSLKSISAENGTLKDKNFKLTVTAEAEGPVTVTLPADTVEDEDGNKNLETINTGNSVEYIPDTAEPTLVSFTSETPDGTYGPGEEIDITATYDESIKDESKITVTLNNGATVDLTARLAALQNNKSNGTILTGYYTVGDVGSGEDTGDLTVESIQTESISDQNGNEQESSSVPASPNNLGDSKDIVIDGTEQTPTNNNSGGGSGGGGGGSGANGPISDENAAYFRASYYNYNNTSDTTEAGDIGSATESTGGQVLGAETFRFLINLSSGMSNDDVRELQNRLTAEGSYSGPVTGYFGPLTLEATIAYQETHGISPAVGYVGPLTRAELNSSNAPTGELTQEEQEAIQEQINALLAIVESLLEQLADLDSM